MQPMPDYSDEEKYALLETYAPRVWFKGDERYWPSSVEWAFPYLNRVKRSDNNYWLNTKEALDSPSDGTLEVFSGNLETAPVYAYFIKKQIPVIEVVDLVYFFYFPYNRGKSAFDTIFGNHVGDWEHITVRLTWQPGNMGWEVKPDQVYVAAHNFGGAYDWDDPAVEKVSDTHQVVYSAWGSHGIWIDAGNHKYNEACALFVCYDLVDECGAGVAWDTWENIVAFDYYDVSGNKGRGLGGSQWPTWMSNDFTNPGCDWLQDPQCDQDPAVGAIWRWGNPAWGEVFGYYRLENGPSGPVSKGVMWSHELQ